MFYRYTVHIVYSITGREYTVYIYHTIRYTAYGIRYTIRYILYGLYTLNGKYIRCLFTVLANPSCMPLLLQLFQMLEAAASDLHTCTHTYTHTHIRISAHT